MSPSTSSGKKVVDLWGGVADAGDAAGPTPRTRCSSCSPRPRAPRRCAPTSWRERGELDYDEKVAEYWPEFAAERQGRDHGRLAAVPPGRAARGRRHASTPTRPSTWEPIIDAPRRAGAAVGAGHGARLPRPDLRLAGRRARAPRQRQEPRHVLRRRGRRRRSGSTSGSGCPRSRRPRVAPLVAADRRPPTRRCRR